MTAAAKSFLLPEEDPELRRWLFCAATVVALHAGLIFWLMHRHDLSAAGAPPVVVIMDLPAMEVAPASDNPVEGPKMTEAQPEETEMPEAMAVPELPPAQKPAAVLMPPPKPKAKPKKKELPKPVVKLTHEPPAPRTSAPKHFEATRGQAAAAPRRGTAGSAASAKAEWSAEVSAHVQRHKPSGGEAKGVVNLAFSLARSGHLLGARIAGSSGSSTLDQEALQSIRSANPFPPAPAEFAGGTGSFTVPVRFH